LVPDMLYHPIGVVERSSQAPMRPEWMRAQTSRLVLEPHFAAAVEALEIGQHLLVLYHLYQADPWQAEYMPELFIRRIASRPNPIGVTLTRVVGRQAATIDVVGLDAINGSPILDIKPYLPIWDAPPVTPGERG
jgi:tRNA (adenine37-N6)-methyltransferase